MCGLVTRQVQSVATHVTATSHSCDASARLIIFQKTIIGQSVAMGKKEKNAAHQSYEKVR